MRSYSVTMKSYARGGELQELFGGVVIAPSIRSAVGKAIEAIEQNAKNTISNLTVTVLAGGAVRSHNHQTDFSFQSNLEA